jgi:hypothetical protein
MKRDALHIEQILCCSGYHTHTLARLEATDVRHGSMSGSSKQQQQSLRCFTQIQEIQHKISVAFLWCVFPFEPGTDLEPFFQISLNGGIPALRQVDTMHAEASRSLAVIKFLLKGGETENT